MLNLRITPPAGFDRRGDADSRRLFGKQHWGSVSRILLQVRQELGRRGTGMGGWLGEAWPSRLGPGKWARQESVGTGFGEASPILLQVQKKVGWGGERAVRVGLRSIGANGN